MEHCSKPGQAVQPPDQGHSQTFIRFLYKPFHFSSQALLLILWLLVSAGGRVGGGAQWLGHVIAL